MLFGEKTYLPMYQTIYHGSLVDNKTLANTIIEFSAIVGSFNFKLVMDRGFYSLDNIKFMITKVGLKFIIGVPFTTNYSKKLVENVIDHIDRANNYIKTSSKGDTIKGLHRHVAIINDKIKVINDKELENYSNFIILSAFVYYNSNKRLRELNKLTKNLAEAKGDIVKDNSNIVKYKDFVDKFFDITYSNGVIVNISINEDKLSEHVKFYGYSVYLSNDTFNTEETYLYYVKKDVVEKSFHHFKAYLGLDRPYCHGNKRLLNKSFIMQLCQIIYCSIHKIMQDKDLFDQFPIKKMLAIMSELKSFNIKDCEYLRPITSKQKKIYKYFDIQLPSIKDNKIDF
jgi:transposase